MNPAYLFWMPFFCQCQIAMILLEPNSYRRESSHDDQDSSGATDRIDNLD